MRALIGILAGILLAALLAGCTVAHHVRDIRVAPQGHYLEAEKCNLKVYIALYGLVATEENCRWEQVS